MVSLDIGRDGVILLVLLFLVFGLEDVVIWVNSGTLPATEFFVGIVVVLAVVALAIYEARGHQPPGG